MVECVVDSFIDYGPFQRAVSRCENGCVTYAAVPEQPNEPARVEHDPALGWNAGARSIDTKGGGCYVEFDMPAVTGVVCGLTNEFRSTDPYDVSHGFFIESAGGVSQYSVVEQGVQVTTPAIHAADALFRIERQAGQVTYKVAGITVHTSTLDLYGRVVVVGLMYAAPDGIGRAA